MITSKLTYKQRVQHLWWKPVVATIFFLLILIFSLYCDRNENKDNQHSAMASETKTAMAKLFKLRRQHLQKACRQMYGITDDNITINYPSLDELQRSSTSIFIDDHLGIIFCRYLPTQLLEKFAFRNLITCFLYVQVSYLLRHKQFLCKKIPFYSIPKVASTTWMKIFSSDKVNPNLNSTNLKPINYAIQNQSQVFEFWNRVSNYRKIIWVRHPLERILSAWRDKFKMSTNSYYRNVS